MLLDLMGSLPGAQKLELCPDGAKAFLEECLSYGDGNRVRVTECKADAHGYLTIVFECVEPD